MKFLFELFKINDPSPEILYRLILSLFCLFTFILLKYFWELSRKNSDAKLANKRGLQFLFIAFLLYFLLGFVSAYKPPKYILLILSGLISCSFLGSLSFFVQKYPYVDNIVKSKLWSIGVVVLGVLWCIVVSISDSLKIIHDVEIIISSVTTLILGIFLAGAFFQKRLKLLGLITIMVIVIIVVLQIEAPQLFGKGKFELMNITMLSPAIFLSIITISFTYGWVNRLTYVELSHVFTDNTSDQEHIKTTDVKFSEEVSQGWRDRIAKDELEIVIEEMINYKQNEGEISKTLLILAGSNHRNNSNRMHTRITREEYEINRIKTSDAVLSLIT